MDLWTSLSSLGERAVQLVAHVETEEATKTALVLPFLQAMGYDVFNPSEVIPEFTADVGIKKGEKVDYAVCRDGQPTILIECKPHGASLDTYSGQLFRYFSVTNARLAILTDGVVYRFYSDLVAPNKLDEHPFMTFVLTAMKRDVVAQMEKLTKHNFNLEQILEQAEGLRFINQLRSRFEKELDAPSDDFVRVLCDPIYDGRFTQQATDRFRNLVRTALRSHISEAVDKRLRAALDSNSEGEQARPAATDDQPEDDQASEIETTAEELQGLYVIKAICRDLVEPTRIHPRDVRSYFGVLLDDNNRKPICRLWFNGTKKYVGVFDDNKQESRLPVEGPDGLFRHADAIRQSLQRVLGK